ncbi:MAG: isoprenylcysteine carboxylmethyltransferase family protein [Alphaproteobacteria bacterium]|nr:isoprenylcysteine carboxylmethyltransferase family protein [Alphaproteobacteria bacterium]
MSDTQKGGGDPRVKTRIRATRAVAVVVLLGLLFVAPSWGRHGLVTEIMRWTGYLGLIAGVMGRVWCSAYIGGRKSQLIIDVGPYSMTRNPLYVFSFMGLVGIGLVSGMLTFTLAFALAFALYYRGVVAGEETFLSGLHPDEFGDYVKRVPRWIPNPRLYREATESMGLPRNVLITIRETSTFFLAFPLLTLIGWLQDTGVLPVLLRLP